MPQRPEIITAAPRLDEQNSQRVYRVKEPERHAANFFIVAVGSLFLSLTFLFWAGVLPYGVSHPDRGSLDALLGFCLVFAGIALFIGSGYNKKVILHADAIEVKGWFRSRKLSFVDIRGRQTNASSRSKYGYAYIFVPTDDRKRKLAIPGSMLHTDQFFRDWIKSIPEIPRH
jgi:hypothetical protein